MKHILTTAFVLLICAAAMSATVTGAQVDSATMQQGIAVIVVSSKCDQNITNFTLQITFTYPDGRKAQAGHTVDYGIEGNSLKPHASLTQRITPPVADEVVSQVVAKVTVVIYQDNTAEVSDTQAFEHTFKERQRIARTFQQIATIFESASTRDDVGTQLSKLVTGSRLEYNNYDPTWDRSFLDNIASIMLTAPQGAEEHAFIKEQAVHYRKRSNALAGYASIRRVQ